MLPPLREDLSLHRGPPAADGAPTWTIRDPLRNRFFRIGWPAFEMLARWDLGGAAAVAAAVRGNTTLDVGPGDVEDLADFLTGNQLTRVARPEETARLVRDAAAARRSSLGWLLHNYLFFRLPLIRPDRFLGATLGGVAWLGSRRFLILTLVVLGLGLLLIHRQWDLFAATFAATFTPSGLIAFGVALSGVKVVHELAHAYAAKRFGCRVPTMGVAFLVMLPVLYTDVNEAWTLVSRRRRMAVGAAGMLAELTVAAWATVAWALLPDGPARQAAFILAAVTWISSLAINLSPFMRFDGYFLLMDALEMPNLHARSFALARWRLRELLFGLGAPPPEPLSTARRRALIAFAIATWAYRLVLFLGIALLVYHLFFKVAGVVLFVVEIGWFVVLPIVREIQEWGRLRHAIAARRRISWTLAVILLGLGFGLVPWTARISAPAVMKGAATAELRLPFPARLERIAVQRGDAVTDGTPLFVFSAPGLTHRLRRIEARKAGAEHELNAATLDPALRAQGVVIRERLAKAEAEHAALVAEAARLVLTAPMDGVLLDPMPDLRPGQWLAPQQRLAMVRSDAPAVADAYVDEDDLDRLSTGSETTFYPNAADFPPVRGRVAGIDRAPVRALADDSLASPHGGPLASRVSGAELVPERALYRIRIALDGPPPSVQLVGRAVVSGEARSLFGRLARSILIVLIREWET